MLMDPLISIMQIHLSSPSGHAVYPAFDVFHSGGCHHPFLISNASSSFSLSDSVASTATVAFFTPRSKEAELPQWLPEGAVIQLRNVKEY